MAVRRSTSLPPPRATALLARTMYRELRRANYDDQDLVRFIADLMDVVATNLHAVDPGAERELSGVIDPETGLPNITTFEEILEFELRRVDERGEGTLLVLCVEVSIPAWCSDDVAAAVHERTALALERCVRGGDVVARQPPNRYLVLLARATSALVLPLCTRMGAALHGEGSGTELPRGTRYSVRWVERSVASGSGAQLIDQCIHAAALPLGVVEDEHPAPTIDASLVPPQSTPKSSGAGRRRIVLALAGGAVRAAAHIGVLDVLADAGIEIAGIAGTSAGALIGAMLLSGMSRDDIAERFASFATTPLYYRIRRLYAGYVRRARRSRHAEAYFRQSGLAFMSDVELAAVPDDAFAEFIEHFIGKDRDIASLSAPFAANALDIVDGRSAIFMRGPLHQALRASCAVPGLFSPQSEGTRLLVDGSVVTELPIPAALGLRTGSPVVGVFLERSSKKVSTFKTSSEVLTRSAALVHTELVREQLTRAPVVLTVPVQDVGWLDFRRAHEIRQLGEGVARVALEGLLADLDRAGRRL